MSTERRPKAKGLRDTLFVGNLPPHLSADDQLHELERAARKHGTVEECEVYREHDGTSRNFGHVKMTSGAESAKSALDNTVVQGCAIKVRWALDTSTLCVCDLGPDVTQETLKQGFHQFGTVVSCWVDKDPPELGGGSRCRGFVEYSKRTTAAKVQQLLSHNLFLIGMSPRPVRVEFAVDDAVDDNEGQPAVPGPIEPPPHFAQPGSLEFDFALKWRELQLAHRAEADQLAEVHRQEREILRKEQRATFDTEKRKFHALDPSLPLPDPAASFERTPTLAPPKPMPREPGPRTTMPRESERSPAQSSKWPRH